MVGARQQAEASRQLRVESEPLRFGAQIAQDRRQIAGVLQTNPRMQEDVDEFQLGGDALPWRQSTGLGASQRDELLDLGIGNQPQASPRRPNAGRRAGRGVTAGLGVPRHLARQLVIGIASRRKNRRDPGVQHRAPRRRQSRVSRGAHQIVGEVDAAVVVGLKHTVAFQITQRTDELSSIGAGELGENRRRNPPTKRRHPQNERARTRVETGKAIPDECVDLGHRLVAARTAPAPSPARTAGCRW